MADNTTVNSVAVATRSVTYSGDAAQNAQVVGLVAFSGSDDAKTATDIPGDANGLEVQGGVAHDAADAGNPDKVGAQAIAGVSGATLVAAADRTNLYAGLDGVLIERPHCGLEDIVSGRISDATGNATDIIAAQAAGIKMYLMAVTLYNSSATNIYADILDGATIKWTIPVPAYGGAHIAFPIPIPGSAATAWRLDGSAAVSTLYASALAFKSKV